MIFRLDDRLVFPNPSLAEEDGLLAIGGDLSTAIACYWPIKMAFSHGTAMTILSCGIRRMSGLYFIHPS
jgi:hypothetical protein